MFSAISSEPEMFWTCTYIRSVKLQFRINFISDDGQHSKPTILYFLVVPHTYYN